MTFKISQMLTGPHAEHLRTVLLRCERLGLVKICAANSKCWLTGRSNGRRIHQIRRHPLIVGFCPMQHFSICKSLMGHHSQRRTHERHSTVVKSIRIISEHSVEVCNVRQVTSGCAVADVSSNYSLNEAVTLDLSHSKTVKAYVGWAFNKTIGLKLRRQDDLAAISLGHGAKGSQFCKYPLDFLAEGNVLVGQEVRNVLIENISQTGIRILCGMEIPVGSAVKLDIPNLASETAIVRWSNDGMTGLSFVSELRLISLRQWLDAHRHPYAGFSHASSRA